MASWQEVFQEEPMHWCSLRFNGDLNQGPDPETTNGTTPILKHVLNFILLDRGPGESYFRPSCQKGWHPPMKG